MFMKHLVVFFKRLFRRNKEIKTLNLEKIAKTKTQLNEWEVLCDTCASIAEKANWTEEDSDKLIKHVRKELHIRKKGEYIK